VARNHAQQCVHERILWVKQLLRSQCDCGPSYYRTETGSPFYFIKTDKLIGLDDIDSIPCCLLETEVSQFAFETSRANSSERIQCGLLIENEHTLC
jgi:hypothetical protein